MTASPQGGHQFATGRLHVALATYLERERVGVVISAPADVSWGRRDVVVQPDVFVVPIDEAREVHATNSWLAIRHLLLAVEVVSPSSGRADRFTKRTLYQRMGVPFYWVLDPDRHEAEVWTPDRHFPEIERERLTWHPEGAAEPFTRDLPALFAPP